MNLKMKKARTNNPRYFFDISRYIMYMRTNKHVHDTYGLDTKFNGQIYRFTIPTAAISAGFLHG